MKYSFNSDIESALKGFEDYLAKEGYKTATIRQKSNYAGYFLAWIESERLAPQDARYNDLLNLADGCRLEGKSGKLTSRIMESIRHYYRYLQKQNPAINNPAGGFFIRTTRQKAVGGIIDFTELEKLYQEYPESSQRIILGLFIYQGITTDELHHLQPEHLKLDRGKIHIPGNRRRNSRTLELKPFQILELYQYTANKPKDQPLFTGSKGSANLKNGLATLFKNIRKTYPDIQSAKQLRSGAIAHWLKTHNLRQVQYMAGHKYVSSTEHYLQNNLDSLQERLEKLHPLGLA